MKWGKKKTMIDVDKAKDEKILGYLKQIDKKDCGITHSEDETDSSTAFKKNKAKIESVFMDVEYIRCPVTKVIVVNSNLFKGG
ncbi:hypothetical protein NRK67_13030 [Fusobacteria bacterium ZRK30]|nr:hypothetical protein NRK67_13030 [Fusobacteria bacterium ZRK30]